MGLFSNFMFGHLLWYFFYKELKKVKKRCRTFFFIFLRIFFLGLESKNGHFWSFFEKNLKKLKKSEKK